jgi:hypothetical protein
MPRAAKTPSFSRQRSSVIEGLGLYREEAYGENGGHQLKAD